MKRKKHTKQFMKYLYREMEEANITYTILYNWRTGRTEPDKEILNKYELIKHYIENGSKK